MRQIRKPKTVKKVKSVSSDVRIWQLLELYSQKDVRPVANLTEKILVEWAHNCQDEDVARLREELFR